MQLEEPARFLPTGEFLLGALDGLLTLKIRREQEPKQTPQNQSPHIFCVLLWATKWHCCFVTSQPRESSREGSIVPYQNQNSLREDLVGLFQ